MGEKGNLVFSARQAAELLGLSRNSIYQGITTGEIPSVRVGKRILIPRLSLEKMLAQETNKTVDQERQLKKEA